MKPSFIRSLLIVICIVCCYSLLFSQTIAEPPSNINQSNAGTAANPFLISSLANLRWLSETRDYWGGERSPHTFPLYYVYYLQTADIDATETIDWNDGAGFAPIGTPAMWANEGFDTEFYGQYDGNNYKILNLFTQFFVYSLPPEQDSIYWRSDLGLFGYVKNTTIKNVRMVNARVVFGDLPEGFWDEGSTGILVGGAYNSTITNCSVDGTIVKLPGELGAYYRKYIGGIVGSAGDTVIESCKSSVDITITAENDYIVGGLAGAFYGGWLSLSSLSNSFFCGDINLNRTDTGTRFPSYGGGLVGSIYKSSITNCYVVSNNSFSNAAGLAGKLGESMPPQSLPLNLTNNIWNAETTTVDVPFISSENDELMVINNNHGLTTSQMKAAETYMALGWDFENIWGISPEYNNGYPYLRSMDGPVSEKDSVINLQSNLIGNYPNPFNPSTTIAFEVAREGNVHIAVYNTKGQQVAVLTDRVYGFGKHTVVWNGHDDSGRPVSSGVYFYRMSASEHTAVRKMLLLK